MADLCMAIDYDLKPVNNNNWVQMMDADKMNVAIIGAGASGLAALRVLTQGPQNFNVTLFERSQVVGGLWNYSTNNDGPMYQNLKTNLCVQGMMFPGFSFPFTTSHAYPTHKEIARYLHEFADSFNAREFIRFGTSVIKVEPIQGSRADRPDWLVRSINADNNEIEERYQAVMVCNGHFDFPSEPIIPGMKDHFQGRILHSRYYDRPEEFANQRVLVLGAANSGQDIAVELASQASRVYLSHNGSVISAAVPQNLCQVSGIVAAEAQGLRLKDGSLLSPAPDAIVFATGYNSSLGQFLTPGCNIRAENGRVFPLFKNLINPNHPSMFLLGLLNDVAQFPMFHIQALAARAALEDRWRLPIGQEMLRQSQADFARAMRVYGKPRHVHLMRDEQWSYNSELLECAGFQASGLPTFVKEVFNACWYLRRRYLCQFRELSVLVSRPDCRMVVVPDRADLRLSEEDLEGIRAINEGRSPHPAAIRPAVESTPVLEKRNKMSERDEIFASAPSRKRGSSCSSQRHSRTLVRALSYVGSSG